MSRKSCPKASAMLYSVSPACTTYTPPCASRTGIGGAAGSAVVALDAEAASATWVWERSTMGASCVGDTTQPARAALTHDAAIADLRGQPFGFIAPPSSRFLAPEARSVPVRAPGGQCGLPGSWTAR